jgi:transposase
MSRLQAVPATVPAITELAAELKALGVQMVSTEATSDYWRIWFVVLEEAGLAVQLVSSSQARNLPGRPKTDKEDARWIARLTEMGMLRSSFVPPPLCAPSTQRASQRLAFRWMPVALAHTACEDDLHPVHRACVSPVTEMSFPPG